jgi:hypothetical protein
LPPIYLSPTTFSGLVAFDNVNDPRPPWSIIAAVDVGGKVYRGSQLPFSNYKRSDYRTEATLRVLESGTRERALLSAGGILTVVIQFDQNALTVERCVVLDPSANPGDLDAGVPDGGACTP